MLNEITDAFADLVDYVDRSVSSIMKGPIHPPTPRYVPPPYSESQRQQPGMTNRHTKHAPSLWTTPLVSTPSPATIRSDQHLPKRIPFQKKAKAQPPRKTLNFKSPASKAKVAPTNTTVKPKASQRPIVLSPSSSYPKVPTPAKHNGLISSDVQCDASRCDILVFAIADLETCKEVFGGWSAQFNLVESSVKKRNKLEQGIVLAVDKLKRDATSALHSSYSILSSYRGLTRLMDKQLDAISRSPSGGGDLFNGSAGAEVRRLSASVKAHSTYLTEHVRKIQDCLRELVHGIEKTKEKAASKAMRRKIWHWFVRIFRALSLLISAGGTIFNLVYPVGLVGSISFAAASTLAAAVAKLCEMVENKFSETTFDSILRLLRTQIPESAKVAELSLTSFQACHRILQLELQVRSGKRSAWIGSSEAQRAHGSWKEAGHRLRAIER
ncbi:hypothetical protein SCHPADRAFT_536759 [Schizopora paradoxa]|uniref:Uncharacterized protein n=1 Tax=Schizopora paradoxa TaxID=27342 RepID=A0A0H2RE40_9AGAM|nr:hypothetical protein SCHPADRAFT_536759 [Schizopora paradoxa]